MKISLMWEFVTLARVQNFSRAAEELYIAQPALSRHIASMENEWNVKLIDRTRNSFSLTPQGEEAVVSCKKILQEYEVFLERIGRQNGIEGGEIHVGYLYYDKDFYIARIREVFHEKYPKVRLILHPYQPTELEKDLLSGRLDAAIVYGASGCKIPGIQTRAFLKLPYSLIVADTHPLAALEEIDAASLTGEKLLYPEEKMTFNGAQEGLNRMLETYGVEMRQSVPVNNFDEVPWILQETGGVYISPMVNPNAYGDHVVSRYLMQDEYSCDVSVIWKTENKNPRMELLLSAIRICYS